MKTIFCLLVVYGVSFNALARNTLPGKKYDVSIACDVVEYPGQSKEIKYLLETSSSAVSERLNATVSARTNSHVKIIVGANLYLSARDKSTPPIFVHVGTEDQMTASGTFSEEQDRIGYGSTDWSMNISNCRFVFN